MIPATADALYDQGHHDSYPLHTVIWCFHLLFAFANHLRYIMDDIRIISNVYHGGDRNLLLILVGQEKSRPKIQVSNAFVSLTNPPLFIDHTWQYYLDNLTSPRISTLGTSITSFPSCGQL